MSSFGYAQKNAKTIPYSSEEYIVALEEHFSPKTIPDKDKKGAKSLMKDLEEKWEIGYFSNDIKERIYETSNMMLQNKMRAVPYFRDYYYALIAIIDKEIPDATVKKWMSSVDLVLKKKKKREFTTYLISSLALFQENYIFSNRIIKWKVGNNWDLNVDSTIRYLFNNTDLVCYTKRDSSNIYGTSGIYHVLDNHWDGEGGRIDWQRADLDQNEIYANLNDYQIEMNMSKFEADSVEFFNYRYFDVPLLGELEEQVLASRRGSKALFPAFTSYTKQWKIPEIFENIDFSGGFKVEGARLIGIGDAKDPVILTFKRNGKKFITLSSNSFSISFDKIRSQNSRVTIHYQQDSIYHSGLRMNYIDKTKELSLIRDERGVRAAPFFNTFHQLDMIVEAAYWKMDEDVMDFDMIKGMTKRPAFFTSNNSYSQQHFEELLGMDAQHPLYLLNKYTKETGSSVVRIIDYTNFLRMPYEQVKLQLLSLANQGFVIFDADNDQVIVKDRTSFYLNARMGKVDYDVISFQSANTKLTNAELQLDSFDLRINGVQRIILSDSQNLVIEPGNTGIATDEYIVVSKNRNFRFNGKITAGRFSFKSWGCTFDYNTFKLDMPQIDSLWFWVEGKPLLAGGRERKQVQTALINLSGDLLIDHPSNKSGLKPYKEYPIFNSKKDSYAYYDQYFIEKGVYTRDRFYFRISPFVLQSLDNIKTEDIRFDGFLYSGGIFPDIAEPLRVMDDFSLGFKKGTPERGLPAYGDKGVFFNTVSLSNRGLRGDGDLNYLSSKTMASEYIFYLDSMNVHAESFNIAPTMSAVEFPTVSGKNVYQHWMPYQDEMQIYSKEEFINMYDEETSIEGMLSLKPTGLNGRGKLHYRVAFMTSNNYDFQNLTYHADTVNFKDDGWELSDFSADADYTERKVLFASNGGTSLVKFPENQYICYMDEATWYMDKDETTYSKKDATMPEELAGKSIRELVDIEITGSEFHSVHPLQDSLTFTSTKASFNSRKKVIKADGVIKILVADAAIYPVDLSVTILKEANMVPLEGAKVLANTTTKYHEINDAEVKINGKNGYLASGSYVYIDKNDMKQNIFFSNVSVDTTLQTVASGTVLIEQGFTLSPAFEYFGDVGLLASREALEFDGGFKLKTACIPQEHWIGFKSIIDPMNVMIPIPKQPRVPHISNTRKYVGIANNIDDREVYSIFLENKKQYYDSILISATGYILYDQRSSEYRISTEEKLNQFSRPDNYISYNANTCKTHAEGNLRFDVKTENFHMKSWGMVEEKDTYADFTVATAFDFHFSEKALAVIVNIFKTAEDDFYNLGSDFYSKVAGGFMGIKEADKYMSDITMGKNKRTPDALQHTIFINEMNMKWNTSTRSYISKGKYAIGGFLKDRINSEVEGYVEFRKVGSGDEINIYFEVGDEWFYFHYKGEALKVFSSVAKFNEIINEDVNGKGNKNEMKEDNEKGKKSKFRYNLCNTKKKDDFINRIKPYI